jgi:hypothetical protein
MKMIAGSGKKRRKAKTSFSLGSFLGLLAVIAVILLPLLSKKFDMGRE